MMDGSFFPSSQSFLLVMVVEEQRFSEDAEDEQTILASVMEMAPPASHVTENLNPGVTLRNVSSRQLTRQDSQVGQLVDFHDLQPGLHHVSQEPAQANIASHVAVPLPSASHQDLLA